MAIFSVIIVVDTQTVIKAESLTTCHQHHWFSGRPSRPNLSPQLKSVWTELWTSILWTWAQIGPNWVRKDVLLSKIELLFIFCWHAMGEQFEYYNLACKFFKVFFIGRHYSRIISLDLFDGAFLIKEVFNQGRFWKSNLRKKKKANWNNSKIYFRTLLKWLKPQNKWKIHPGKNYIFRIFSKISISGNSREPRTPWPVF